MKSFTLTIFTIVIIVRLAVNQRIPKAMEDMLDLSFLPGEKKVTFVHLLAAYEGVFKLEKATATPNESALQRT